MIDLNWNNLMFGACRIWLRSDNGLCAGQPGSRGERSPGMSSRVTTSEPIVPAESYSNILAPFHTLQDLARLVGIWAFPAQRYRSLRRQASRASDIVSRSVQSACDNQCSPMAALAWRYLLSILLNEAIAAGTGDALSGWKGGVGGSERSAYRIVSFLDALHALPLHSPTPTFTSRKKRKLCISSQDLRQELGRQDTQCLFTWQPSFRI